MARQAARHPRPGNLLWLSIERQLKQGDLLVTRSKTPYELSFRSRAGQELDVIMVHLAKDRFLAVPALPGGHDVPPLNTGSTGYSSSSIARRGGRKSKFPAASR